MGYTTPLINAVCSKLKCSMASCIRYYKEMYSLQSSYISRNVLIFFFSWLITSLSKYFNAYMVFMHNKAVNAKYILQ